MNNPIEEEEPLDPVMERVRVKMVRLLSISIGLMLLALITVLGAVVYKISQDAGQEEALTPAPVAGEGNPVRAPLQETIRLDIPDGSSVLSSRIDGTRMLLDLRLENGAREFWVLEMQTGNVISRVIAE